jgi:hypothetical protein
VYVHVAVSLVAKQKERLRRNFDKATCSRTRRCVRKEYTSSGLTVVGDVVKPGAYSTLGPHRLFDAIQAAGGLSKRPLTGR